MYKNNLSGVYCLKTLNTKLIYIGSSETLSTRKALHKSAIKSRDTRRANAEILSTISQGDTYQFEVIELCDNLLEREQYWIDFYKKQDTYKLVNKFDANRLDSDCPQEFRDKMSDISKERWKNPTYREQILKSSFATRFTPERLNKLLHCFNFYTGVYIRTCPSAKLAAEELGLSKSSIAAAAKGKFRGSFKYSNIIFIYQEIGVLYKLDELLETHQELRAISSQAWEVFNKYHEGSTTNQ